MPNIFIMDLGYELINLTTKANLGYVKFINLLHDYYCCEKHTLITYNEFIVDHYIHEAKELKPYSLYQLSLMYLFGFGLECDKVFALELLKKSIELNCSQAYYSLAIYNHWNMYECNDYGSIDELLNKAINLNNSNAYLSLAIWNHDNNKLFLKYIKKSIKLNNSNAFLKLGQHYQNKHNYSLAKKYYKQGCKRCNSQCFYELAIMYKDAGKNNKLNSNFYKNDIRVQKLFKKSIELGNFDAIVNYGLSCETLGEYDEAKKHYKLGIKYNYHDAYYYLGKLYMNHYLSNCSNNTIKAVRLFIIGAKLNNEKSIIMLKDLCIDINNAEYEIDLRSIKN